MDQHAFSSGFSRRLVRAGMVPAVMGALIVLYPWVSSAPAAEPAQAPASVTPAPGDDLQVEVTKKGLGKEVVMRKGSKEWYMLIEVTEGTSVVIRQEKDHDTYIVDESETHDHALSKGEVDTAIEDFINSVKFQTKRK